MYKKVRTIRTNIRYVKSRGLHSHDIGERLLVLVLLLVLLLLLVQPAEEAECGINTHRHLMAWLTAPVWPI